MRLPKGRSIVVLAKQKYDLRMRELPQNAESIPFSAETRISGVNIDGQAYRKGAADAIIHFVEEWRRHDSTGTCSIM